jgi:hypothetical protein
MAAILNTHLAYTPAKLAQETSRALAFAAFLSLVEPQGK